MSVVRNKKAFFDYNILEKINCGIVLVGSEVKSIKNGNVELKGSYCYIDNGEVFIKGMNISEHKQGGKANNHEPLRDRKLLLKKKEIKNLEESLGQNGLTLIPLEVFVTKTGLIKVEIGLGRGKNSVDKKQSLKEKDLKRELERNI